MVYVNLCYIVLLTCVPVWCSTRTFKWLANSDRENLSFPNPIFVKEDFSALRCIAVCADTDTCDGVTFSSSTFVCRGHVFYDVSDVGSGVASPNTKIWINADCRRIDYSYVYTLDWCVRVVPMILPYSKSLAESMCQSQQARLVHVNSREKHDELTKKLLPLVSFWISGTKSGGVWTMDDGTPLSTDSDLWNPLPAVPLLSNCMCYFGNLFWPCLCVGISGYICEEV
ncbi:uncharacterized protein [Argopecten irradians]|uniref:uncharacterized protein n=1 Tax=Argopecten irradians TaxID=31199 RepID=UPI00371657E3